MLKEHGRDSIHTTDVPMTTERLNLPKLYHTVQEFEIGDDAYTSGGLKVVIQDCILTPDNPGPNVTYRVAPLDEFFNNSATIHYEHALFTRETLFNYCSDQIDAHELIIKEHEQTLSDFDNGVFEPGIARELPQQIFKMIDTSDALIVHFDTIIDLIAPTPDTMPPSVADPVTM